MKRLSLRVAIAIAAFAVGVAVATFYRLRDTPAISQPAQPVAEARLKDDCYPGKSTAITLTTGTAHFPKELLSQDERRARMMNEWYAKHLTAMEEGPLFSPDKNVLESYRFLWLRSFHHPVGVRIWRSSTGHFISVKEMSGAGGYEPGSFILKEQRPITADEWDTFMRLLKDSCYWGQPTEDPNDRGLDGAEWILEGVREDRYHLVDRWTPESGSFREACLYLLKLSQLPIDTKQEPLY